MLPPEPLSGAIFAGVAAKKFADKVATDIYDAVKAVASKEFQSLKNKKQWTTLYKKASTVRLVKTLWQIDKAVDLAVFYYPTKLSVGGKKKKVVTEYDDFADGSPLVVEGIAGQGKSIFLRYLCAMELQLNTRIPLFIELRKYDERGLLAQIADSFSALGLEGDNDFILALLKSGKLLLLLDAFDEVEGKLRQKCIGDIEKLVEQAPGFPLVISSRPNSGIQASRLFHVTKICDLEGNEYQDVIRKLCADGAFASDIIGQITKSHSPIGQMLTTPLFVTLLVIQFKASQQIPESVAGFYDSLFDVLLKRHDGTKPGYLRPRQCGHNDRSIRLLFEAFCFVIKFATGTEYSEEKILSCAELAAKEVSCKVDPQLFVDDIVKVTCLLIEEGGQYRFIHKSVQEYYCAAFIKRRPTDWAKKFYGQIRGRKAQEWAQEIYFLSEIDAFRADSFFTIPELQEFLTGSESLETWAAGKYNQLIGVALEPPNSPIRFGFRTELPYFQSERVISSIRNGAGIFSSSPENDAVVMAEMRKRSPIQIGLYEMAIFRGNVAVLNDCAKALIERTKLELSTRQNRVRKDDDWTGFHEFKTKLGEAKK